MNWSDFCQNLKNVILGTFLGLFEPFWSIWFFFVFFQKSGSITLFYSCLSNFKQKKKWWTILRSYTATGRTEKQIDEHNQIHQHNQIHNQIHRTLPLAQVTNIVSNLCLLCRFREVLFLWFLDFFFLAWVLSKWQ